MYPYKKFQRSSKKIHVLSTRANRVKTYSIDQWKEKLQNQLEGVKPKISGLKRGTQVLLLLATRRSTRWEINCRTRSKKQTDQWRAAPLAQRGLGLQIRASGLRRGSFRQLLFSLRWWRLPALDAAEPTGQWGDGVGGGRTRAGASCGEKGAGWVGLDIYIHLSFFFLSKRLAHLGKN